MKISSITAWQKQLALNYPYSLSGGSLKFEAIDTTFVRIGTDSGLFGWGESCPWGHTYLPAHGPGVRAGLETLAPHLIGHNPCALDNINRVMDVNLPGHPYVKSGLDMACWDILGQAAGMPLWMLLGGAAADPVALNSSIATGSPEAMVALIASASAKGYRTHSAKIGGSDVALDIARMEAIMASLLASEEVTFDVNRAWTPGVAIRVLNCAGASGWVEQPCETLDECAHVASRVANPIMLDECLNSFESHLEAWRRGACEGVKVKPNRLGGLTRARQVRDLGMALGWQMHIEDVGGSALADTAAIHLASATPRRNRLASWLCGDHLDDDSYSKGGVCNRNGFAIPPSKPGMGVTPSLEALGDPSATYS